MKIFRFISKQPRLLSAASLILAVSFSLNAQEPTADINFQVSGDVSIEKIAQAKAGNNALYAPDELIVKGKVVSDDGNWLVYINEQGELISHSFADEQSVQLSQVTQDVQAFDISDDSKWVAYQDVSGAVYKIAIDNSSGAVVLHSGLDKVSLRADTYVYQVEISKDNQHVVFIDFESVQGTEQDGLFVGGSNQGNLFTVGFDGNSVAIQLSNDAPYNYCQDLNYTYCVTHFVISPDGQYIVYNKPLIDAEGCDQPSDVCPATPHVAKTDGSMTAQPLLSVLSFGEYPNPFAVLNDQIEFDTSGRYLLSNMRSDWGFGLTQYSVLSDISIAQGESVRLAARNLTAAYPFEADVNNEYLTYPLTGYISFAGFSPLKNYIVTEYQYVEDDFNQSNELSNYSPLVETKIRSVANPAQADYLYPIYNSVFACQKVVDNQLTVPDCSEARFGDFVISPDESVLIFAARENKSSPIRLYRSALNKDDQVFTLVTLQESQLSTVTHYSHFGNFYNIEKTDFSLAVTNSGQIIYKDSGNFYRVDIDGQNQQLLEGVTGYHVLEENNTVVFAYGDNQVEIFDFAKGELLAEISADSAISADRFRQHQSGKLYYETDTQLYGIEVAPVSALQVENNIWNMVGVADLQESGMTLTQMLNTIGYNVSNYGRNLTMYDIASETGAYSFVGANSVLQPGKAYWLIQSGGDALRYDASGDGASIATDYPGCASSAGCYVLELSTSGFAMKTMSNPLMQNVKWADIRIEVNGVVCTPSQAQTEQYLADVFWDYTGSGYESYSSQLPPSGDAALQAYRGYWVRVLPQAVGATMNLLIPAGEVDEANTPTCSANPV